MHDDKTEIPCKVPLEVEKDNDYLLKFTGERYIPNSIADTWTTGDEHWQRYISSLGLTANKVVLDIACGEGYGSNLIAEDALKVYGVDISKESIEHARHTYIRDNLSFLVGSIEKLDFEKDSIDVIVCFETIEHVDEIIQNKFLDEVKRVLRKDGILIISCPNKAIATDLAYELWDYTNEYHVKEYYISEFKEFLSRYFSNIQYLFQRIENAIILNGDKATTLNVVYSNGKVYDNTQNIIAVCSESLVDINAMNSIVFDKRESYTENMKTHSTLNSQIKKLLIDCDEISKSNIQIISQFESLKNEDEMLKVENETLKVSCQALRSENKTLEISCQSLRTENEMLKFDCQMLRAENETNRGDLQLLKAKNDSLIVDYQFLRNENKIHCVNLQEHQDRMHMLENHLNDLQDNIKTLESEVLAYKNSTIWRITKPLRVVLDFVRRAHKRI